VRKKKKSIIKYHFTSLLLKEYIDNFDIDSEIDMYRENEEYRNNFTIKDYYEKYHFENKIDEDWYDKNICDFTKTLRRGANITDDNGVWVNTSCGDGEYVAELYMKDGEICGIEITC
jgi:hypothetical protein